MLQKAHGHRILMQTEYILNVVFVLNEQIIELFDLIACGKRQQRPFNALTRRIGTQPPVFQTCLELSRKSRESKHWSSALWRI